MKDYKLTKQALKTLTHLAKDNPKVASSILGKYFAYFTQTEMFASQKRKYAKGTKVIDVSATDMAKIQIPPLNVQSEIVRILDTFTELVAELAARKKQYKYYRNLLLSFPEPLETFEK